MSLITDMWMTPAKKRLLRRTVAGGHLEPPPGTVAFSNVVVDATDPGPMKLTATAPDTEQAFKFNVGDLVIFMPHGDTGTPEARMAVYELRAIVDTVAEPDVTFSTDPTDLTALGIDFTGLVIDVIPLAGAWVPPPETKYMTNVVADATDPGANMLKATAASDADANSFTNGDLVIFLAQEGTGTPEAQAAVRTLRAAVQTVAAPDVVFSTAPTDLSGAGIDFTGLVLMVMPAK